MPSERDWVVSLEAKLTVALQAYGVGDWQVRTSAHKKLTYACEVFGYDKEDSPSEPYSSRFETDLLIYDINQDQDRIPRVVIECKLGINTHDVITYSTKAALHKQVHPYLRYGLLIGGYDTALPGRAIRHGAFFDFMMFWSNQDPKQGEWTEFVNVLAQEVQASRVLQNMLAETRSRDRKKFWLFHRTLRLRET